MASREEDTKARETGQGITYRQREEVRRMFGSLSTLIVLFESGVTNPWEPVSKEVNGGVSGYGIAVEKHILHRR